MDKINRLAENLGIDKDFEAAVQAHLKKTGQIPADEPGEADGEEGQNAPLPEKKKTIWIRRNPLKSPDSDE